MTAGLTHDPTTSLRASSGRLAPVPWHAKLLVISLALGLFSGAWGKIGVPLPLDRIVLLGSVLAFLLAAPQHRGGGRARRAVHWVMLLTSLYALVSALAVGSLDNRYAVFGLLDRLLMPYVMFFYAPIALSSAASRRYLYGVFTLVGLYLGVTTIASVLGPTSLLFPSYIGQDVVGRAIGRGHGPSGEPVGTGLVLIFCVAAAVVCVRRWRGLRRSVAVVSAALCVVGTFLTFTRSIWLAGILGFLVVALAFPRVRRLLPALVAAGVVLVVLLFAVSPVISSTAEQRFGTQRSIDDRAYTNEAAISLFLEHPWTGSGWGRFVNSSAPYIWQHDLGPITTVDIEVHNVYLSRAAELGLPGLVLFLLTVLLGPVTALIRGWCGPDDEDSVDLRIVTIVAVVSWLTVAMFTGLSFALPNLLGWGLAGLGVVHIARRRGPGDQTAASVSR